MTLLSSTWIAVPLAGCTVLSRCDVLIDQLEARMLGALPPADVEAPPVSSDEQETPGDDEQQT